MTSEAFVQRVSMDMQHSANIDMGIIERIKTLRGEGSKVHADAVN